MRKRVSRTQATHVRYRPRPMTDDLQAAVDEISWYHTLELAPGVVTPGWFDTRQVAPQLPWPDLTGKRCLDVGTFDGFWAYEMEKRGAAEVVAVDALDPTVWDWPIGSHDEVVEAVGDRKRGGVGFELAHAELGSKVVRHELNIYDISEERLGRFDFIYLGSILLHLRDPIRALERVRSVCDGHVMSVDAIDLPLEFRMRGKPAAQLDGVGRPWWWKPNNAGLKRMVQDGGFDVVSGPTRVWMPMGGSVPRPIATPRKVLRKGGLEVLLTALKGDPHAWILAKPRDLGPQPA